MSELDDNLLHVNAPDTMRTATGRIVAARRLHPDDINVRDIATALGNICRYGGHVNRFMSVAEHSVRVAAIVERAGVSTDQIIAALFHDAHEAYLGDITKPNKVTPDYAFYPALSARADIAIAAHIGIDPALFTNLIVKQADRNEGAREIETYAGTWSPVEGGRRFLSAWQRYDAIRKAA